MKSVLIGVHGLRNKPPRFILTKWWKQSIIEGFKVVKLPVPAFSFEMAYWAQYMHTRAQNPVCSNPHDPLFMGEPYEPGVRFGPRDPQPFRKRITAGLHQQLFQLIAGKTGFLNANRLSDTILRRMFVELAIYYHGKLRTEDGQLRPARELVRGELERLLYKHRTKHICILAHSMGTIIAYDVLMHMKPSIPVHTLITFGSPLGFPVIRKQIERELGMESREPVTLPTPDAITHRWLNFSDLDDVTCLNYNLRNHYRENSTGVRPFDRIVYNNFENNQVANPHKAYGYLRTLDVTQALNTFLVVENAGLMQRIKWLFSRPVM